MKANLDAYEKEILESYEQNEWSSIPEFESRKNTLKEMAKETLRKDSHVNIRISRRDLTQLQRKAVHEGLPYQTFISSVLHKFANSGMFEHEARR